MKRLLRLLTIVMTLTMLISVPVFAWDGSGTGGETSTGSQDMTGKDGATPAKTGYVIYGSDANGNAVTQVFFITTFGVAPSSTSGARMDVSGLKTRFNQPVSKFDTKNPVVWRVPPFGTSSRTGAGEYIKQWLKRIYKDGHTGGEWVLENYLGLSEDEANAFKENEYYINVEAVMWGGVYSGTSHTGRVLVGNATSWAEATDSGNYLGRYTHGNLPNSLAYDIDFMCLSAPFDITNKHSSGEILANVGYGIVSVQPEVGDKQIVKVYKTAGQVDGTSYGTCGEDVSVKNEGSYRVTKWDTGKKKTEVRDTKADYPAVTGGNQGLFQNRV